MDQSFDLRPRTERKNRFLTKVIATCSDILSWRMYKRLSEDWDYPEKMRSVMLPMIREDYQRKYGDEPPPEY